MNTEPFLLGWAFFCGFLAIILRARRGERPRSPGFFQWDVFCLGSSGVAFLLLISGILDGGAP